MNTLVYLVIGAFVGGVLNGLWYYLWGYLGLKPLGKYRHPVLALLEHYHWATILYILGFRLWDLIYPVSPVLVGMATVLLLDESVGQSHKFALGSGHFVPSILIETAIILLWILAELLAGLPL